MPPAAPPSRLAGTGPALLVALALRLAVVWAVARHPYLAVRPDDYLGIARRWLETGWYDAPLWPPVYPAVAALAHLVAPARAVVVLLAINALVGTLSVWLSARVARRLGAGGRGAAVAGWVVALDPLAVLATGAVLSEPLYTFLVLVLVAALVARGAPPGRGEASPALAAGLALGLAALTRAVGALLVLPALAWLAGGSRPRRARARALALLVLGAALVTLPWAARNLAVHGAFRLSASADHNLAALVVGPARSQFEGRPAEASLEVWRAELGDDRGDPDPFRRAARARQAAVAWAVEHPGAVALVLGRSQLALWLGPGRSYLATVLGVPRQGLPAPAVVALALWRGLFAVATLVAVTALLARGGGRGTLLALLLVLVHALPAGAAGYSRFLVPIVPAAALLLALALGRQPQQRARAEPASGRWR